MTISKVKLGLLGTDCSSMRDIADSLRRQPRLRIAAVYDLCLNRAKEESQKLETGVCVSLDGLLRQTLGVIVGEPGWLRAAPLIRAAELQRPALLLTPALRDLSLKCVLEARRAAAASSTLLMPQLSHRWAPSTLRLRELIATRLGAIEAMEAVCDGREGLGDGLSMALDWCCNTIQSEPQVVEVDPENGTIQLHFRRKAANGEPVSARLRPIPSDQAAPFPIVDSTIQCRRGQAQIQGDVQVEWRDERRREQESLSTDRSAHDVMIDLFGRRVVGGIVPVPDLDDLVRIHRLLAAVQTSRRTGQAVSVESIPRV